MSPKQDKHKAKCPKTHINQINKDQTQRTNIKSSKGKTTNNTQGDPQKDNSWSFNRNSSGQEGMAGHTKSDEKNNLQPRLLYPARISFKYEGEIKSFTDKQKLREFSTTKPALQQMLKDLLYIGNTERFIKINPKQQSKWQWDYFLFIFNYLKCKWVECPNQKTKTG